MTSTVLLTGAPGTGKSTLAESAAAALGGAVLAWDWIMGSLTQFEEVQRVFRQLDRERYRSVGWSVIWSLATAQLRGGRSVVIDAVARDMEVDRLREIAAAHGASCLVVWTTCSDEEIHRTRVEGRVRDIPGWHELEWSHVAALRHSLAEPGEVDLRLDAVQPLDDNVKALLAALRR